MSRQTSEVSFKKPTAVGMSLSDSDSTGTRSPSPASRRPPSGAAPPLPAPGESGDTAFVPQVLPPGHNGDIREDLAKVLREAEEARSQNKAHQKALTEVLAQREARQAKALEWLAQLNNGLLESVGGSVEDPFDALDSDDNDDGGDVQ